MFENVVFCLGKKKGWSTSIKRLWNLNQNIHAINLIPQNIKETIPFFSLYLLIWDKWIFSIYVSVYGLSFENI